MNKILLLILFQKERLVLKAMKISILHRMCICITILFFLFFSEQVSAETFYSGTISKDTIWDIAGSPYFLTGDVIVGNETYFDLNKNGQWDSAAEEFSDYGYDKIPLTNDSGENNNRYDFGEPFTDTYPNGKWDSHEPLEKDLNRNNQFDGSFTLTINPGVKIYTFYDDCTFHVTGTLIASGVSFMKSSPLPYQAHFRAQGRGQMNFINCSFDSNIVKWSPGSSGSMKFCTGKPETIIESSDIILFKNEF